jgi:outer membrane protein OmpA-like peptidoglycan-associated protein
MPESKLQPNELEESHSPTHQSLGPGPGPRPTVNPVTAMVIVIVALLAILLGIKLKTPSASQVSESKRMATMTSELEELRRQSGSMGLSTMAGGEQIDEIASRLKKDADSMVLLAGRYRQLVDEANANLVRKNADLVNETKYRQLVTGENDRLKKELQQAKVSGFEADSLRRELAELKTLREAETVEMATMKQQLAGLGELASKADMEGLQRRYEETLRAKEFFESRAKELEGELGKARLFARSENELLPAAVKLFGTLRKLENKSETEISKAYSQIAVDLGASVVKTLTFPTGSAKMGAAEEDPVRALVENVPDGDMLLAIGYASETGNVDGNRTLSSDRATAVAELLTSAKRPGQLVQAVYLGQTDRFSQSKPESNQLVEVWQIRKQP